MPGQDRTLQLQDNTSAVQNGEWRGLHTKMPRIQLSCGYRRARAGKTGVGSSRVQGGAQGEYTAQNRAGAEGLAVGGELSSPRLLGHQPGRAAGHGRRRGPAAFMRPQGSSFPQASTQGGNGTGTDRQRRHRACVAGRGGWRCGSHMAATHYHPPREMRNRVETSTAVLQSPRP